MVLAVTLIVGLMAVCGSTLNVVTVAIEAPIVHLGSIFPLPVLLLTFGSEKETGN